MKYIILNIVWDILLSKNIKIKMYSVVLYGCETCLPLRAEQSLRVCGNRVLSKIFGPKKEGVM
jgi:hypothetical protein